MTSESTCPTCGAAFDSQRGMKSHHTQAHGERLIDRTCELDGCDAPITSYASGQQYCSEGCSQEAKRENQVSVTCANCGNEEWIRRSWYERSQSHYCSTDCRTSAIDRVAVQCACCYKDLNIPPWQYERSESNYCSRQCADLSKRLDFGYGCTLRRYTRPNELRELIRHAHFYEGHSLAATIRIVNHELPTEVTDEKIEEIVADLRTHERNVRNRVWALRPEDLGLSPIGEVATQRQAVTDGGVDQ